MSVTGTFGGVAEDDPGVLRAGSEEENDRMDLIWGVKRSIVRGDAMFGV
jgi:hypothetical protein